MDMDIVKQIHGAAGSACVCIFIDAVRNDQEFRPKVHTRCVFWTCRLQFGGDGIQFCVPATWNESCSKCTADTMQYSFINHEYHWINSFRFHVSNSQLPINLSSPVERAATPDRYWKCAYGPNWAYYYTYEAMVHGNVCSAAKQNSDFLNNSFR